jgi:hypothetical protein
MSGLAGIGIAARLAGAGGMLRRVPWQAWAALAVIIAIGLGAWWHGHKVKSAFAAAERRGEERAYTRVAAQALEIKRKADAASLKISTDLRNQNDVEARNIARTADDLRLRGPGKAACPGRSGLPAAAGGPQPTGRAADAAGDPLPADGGFAAVPWGWLVDRGEQCDLNRAEVISWRAWHQQQSTAWRALQSEPAR